MLLLGVTLRNRNVRGGGDDGGKSSRVIVLWSAHTRRESGGEFRRNSKLARSFLYSSSLIAGYLVKL